MRFKKINGFVSFIIASLIITLVFSSLIQGSSQVISLDKNVYLTDEAIEKEIILYNYFNEGLEFTLNIFTGPFKSSVFQEKIFLSPNQSKTVSYKIYPLEDSFDVTYTANFMVSTLHYNFKEDFKIYQNFNRTCNILLEVESSFLEENRYNLNLIFKNTEENDQLVTIKENKDVNLSFKEILVLKDSVYSYSTVIESNDDEIFVEYACNSVLNKKEVSLEKENSIRRITGYVVLNNFFESLFFKILLVVLLIILVLSFSTRYLRYVNKKQNLKERD